jgi:predicted DNA-binding transcriptional regulator YafY
MFTEDEAEAIAVGVCLLARTGDRGLQKAANSVLSKVTLVVPDPLRDYLTTAPVYVSKTGAPAPARPTCRDLPLVLAFKGCGGCASGPAKTRNGSSASSGRMV